ncbi:MAG: putative quinol monooxygenase [Dermatophilaceae bacterium]
MIIVAGSLRVKPAKRERYLELVATVAPGARRAPGCATPVGQVSAAPAGDVGRRLSG